MEPLPPPDIADAGVALVAPIVDAAESIAPGLSVQAAAMFDVSKLLTHWNALLIVAVWIAIQSTKRAMPDEWFDNGKPAARILPLLPLIFCNIAVWLPGPWLSPDETWGQRIILGTVLGALTANMHTIASRLGIHGLIGIESDTRKLKTSSPPTA